MARESGIKFICDLCGQLIEIGRPRYILKGDITCAYDGGTFDETSEMRNTTLKRSTPTDRPAETVTEKELNDEVHYPFKMDLCASCRRKIYGILERNVALE